MLFIPCATSSLPHSHTIIKGCCQWKEQDRPSLAELSRKLQSGEKSANDKIVLRVPEPVSIERYLQEVGYAESNSYTVFWTQNRRHSQLYQRTIRNELGHDARTLDMTYSESDTSALYPLSQTVWNESSPIFINQICLLYLDNSEGCIIYTTLQWWSDEVTGMSGNDDLRAEDIGKQCICILIKIYLSRLQLYKEMKKK